ASADARHAPFCIRQTAAIAGIDERGWRYGVPVPGKRLADGSARIGIVEGIGQTGTSGTTLAARRAALFLRPDRQDVSCRRRPTLPRDADGGLHCERVVRQAERGHGARAAEERL